MPQRSPEPEAVSVEQPPHVSIVIPVYNEEKILRESLTDLRDKLRAFPWTYEILVSENGSRDGTVALAGEIAKEAPEVKVHSLGEPNYGKAMRQGILRARGTFVICDEIDLCDVDFYRRALDILERDGAEMVVGSKVMRGANDDRPWYRHAATLVLNRMLRLATGFKGTDTHGLKAFRRDALIDTAKRCVVDKDLFASEFVVRAGREGRNVVEIPLTVAEKRKPSVNLLRRVPNVLKNMVKLTYVVRVKK
jgi:glycosyltransferase involved in cell wall biosynthesis